MKTLKKKYNLNIQTFEDATSGIMAQTSGTQNFSTK